MNARVGVCATSDPYSAAMWLEVRTTTERTPRAANRSATSKPSRSGSPTSSRTTSGCRSWAAAIAPWPSAASPTTLTPSASSIRRALARNDGWSSTINTVITSGILIVQATEVHTVIHTIRDSYAERPHGARQRHDLHRPRLPVRLQRPTPGGSAGLALRTRVGHHPPDDRADRQEHLVRGAWAQPGHGRRPREAPPVNLRDADADRPAQAARRDDRGVSRLCRGPGQRSVPRRSAPARAAPPCL